MKLHCPNNDCRHAWWWKQRTSATAYSECPLCGSLSLNPAVAPPPFRQLGPRRVIPESACRSWCNTHHCQACGERLDILTDAPCTDDETGSRCLTGCADEREGGPLARRRLALVREEVSLPSD